MSDPIEWEIEKALFAKAAAFATVSTLVTSTSQLAFPNIAFSRPANGAPWVEVSHMPAPNNRYALGDGELPRITGILQMLCCTPVDNRGPSVLTKLAGEVVSHFPDSLTLWTTGGLRIRVSRRPDVMASAKADETYWGCPVTIRYEVSN